MSISSKLTPTCNTWMIRS
ncbi:unnamed protein product [Chondrus crispus]|uniref:Uncharacterized protein n=1 Tax=Chondrus crispus TaxID=2769 RepID=R7QGP6_CHOCR|nr:unnamed protein product [Chondrus crispus]CDF36580.1 unnamed protein product [Chondrus crispus]|eukprot:XP_005716399.1 unnamed protein product [Chondrus crispus]